MVVWIRQEMKTPTEGGFRNRLTDGVAAAMLPTSKQFTVAETNQLYTISLKSRNKTALVGCVELSVYSLWAYSVKWDWMVDWVKCKRNPSIKPSVKRLQAKMTNMAPKSMNTLLSCPMPVF